MILENYVFKFLFDFVTKSQYIYLFYRWDVYFPSLSVCECVCDVLVVYDVQTEEFDSFSFYRMNDYLSYNKFYFYFIE